MIGDSEFKEREAIAIALIPTGAMAPVDYTIHIHSQYCNACGTTTRWTETYHHNRLRSRAGFKIVDHLIPLTKNAKFEHNVPIRHIFLKPIAVPTCIECMHTINLQHLPTPPIETRVVATKQELEADKKKAVATYAKVSVNDMLEGL